MATAVLGWVLVLLLDEDGRALRAVLRAGLVAFRPPRVARRAVVLFRAPVAALPVPVVRVFAGLLEPVLLVVAMLVFLRSEGLSSRSGPA